MEYNAQLPINCKYTAIKDGKVLPTIKGLLFILEAKEGNEHPCTYCSEITCFSRQNDYQDREVDISDLVETQKNKQQRFIQAGKNISKDFPDADIRKSCIGNGREGMCSIMGVDANPYLNQQFD